ncbi:MAG: type II secretion system GspH family protein [Pirellulales bacterium]|nr:type II secretion system GspH family protein [Pirellulales bacterium]
MTRTGPTARRTSCRRGFTLLEAIVAMAIMAIAGTALISGVFSAIENADFAAEAQIAQGLAAQMLDEIAARRYAESGAGAYQVTLGPEAGETNGVVRTAFDDLDDYAGLSNTPPVDRYGVALGTENGSGATRNAAAAAPASFFSTWRVDVEVNYLNATNLSQTSSTPTDFREVQVKVYRTNGSSPRLVATQRRVFAYVPRP